MWSSWTLGKRIGAGFVLAVGVSLIIAAISLWAVHRLRTGGEHLLGESAHMIEARRLEALAEEELADSLGFLLTRDARLEQRMHEAAGASTDVITRLIAGTNDPGARARLDAVASAEKELDAALNRLVAAHRSDGLSPEAARATARLREEFEKDVSPHVEALRTQVDAYVRHEEESLARGHDRFERTVDWTYRLMAGGGLLAIVLGSVVAVRLTSGVTRDIGAAVQDVQSSSSELQASASQQAAASREQAAATNETTTTIKELVATARQIAESAQRVAQIADRTAGAARSGDETVRRAQDALAGIKKQVDLVVGHMLELGKKSQQIGGILDVINELAEQTNILAINATIEAAGAGEAGRRFGVVADEIRKLADRVGGSTKDIRVLIEEVRTAVNTTVMATEQGTKAVDRGIQQVGDVAASFEQIVGMVATTTEASREIELSTRQQTTAVEQVNIAMSDVSQAAKETEATSSQTSQTASQLATLSRALSRLIRAEARA